MSDADNNAPVVLIVEDDPIIGMMLEDMLRLLKCQTIGPTGSVAAALQIIEATTSGFDAAVLDCNLGDEKVWPVAERLVARDIPFVFSTGYGDAGITATFAGRPVLTKPYSLESLKRALLPILRVAD
jgi:CheY-like chemotaxis protein